MSKSKSNKLEKTINSLPELYVVFQRLSHQQILKIKKELLKPRLKQNKSKPKQIEFNDPLRDTRDISKYFECHVCHKSFKYKSYMAQHVEIVHGRKKNYQCDLCALTFYWKRSLRDHIDSIHQEKKPFKCEICNYKTNQNQNLIRHVKSVHEKVKRFNCQQCEIKFYDKSGLQRHFTRAHTDSLEVKARPFKCAEPECGKAFESAYQLKNHMRSHSFERPHVCFCGREFKLKQSLKDHQIKWHTVSNFSMVYWLATPSAGLNNKTI